MFLRSWFSSVKPECKPLRSDRRPKRRRQPARSRLELEALEERALLSFAGAAFFSAAGSSSAGTGTRALAVADVDRDGILDLAMANSTSNNITVLLGRANGTFVNFGGTFSVGTAPSAVAVGDVGDFLLGSPDGKPDLIVVNSNAGSQNNGNFNLYIGDGATGGFTKFTGFQQNISGDFGVGLDPVAVAAGDLNGDGETDVAVANFGNTSGNNGNVSVALRRGDGGFNAATLSDTAAAHPVAIITGDFNRDGLLDIATANQNGTLSLFFGNGGNLAGTFGTPQNIALGGQPTAVAVGDFNRDGIPDLVVANSNTNAVEVLIGKGDGTFRTAVSYDAGTSPQSVAIADVNGDGKPDLLVANGASVLGGTLSILPGNGDGTFQAPLSLPAGFSPQAVVAGDFNRDGKVDVAVANFKSAILGSSNGGVSVLLNQALSVTTLNATPSPSVAGQTVTLTATVSAIAPATGIATGTVTFVDNGNALGQPQALSSGVATLMTTALAAGSNALTAIYNGDTNFSSSTGQVSTFVDAPLSATAVNVTVAHGITATNLTVATFTDADPNGTASQFKATITWGDGTAPSAGTITAAGNTFTVAGSHTFVAPGRYTVSVAIQDSGGSTAASTSKAVIGSLNERFVSQAYLDLLRRPVDATGLQVFTAALDAGLPPSQVSQGITSSQEYRTDLIAADYQLFLHRTADLSGLGNFLNFLATGGTDEQMAVILTGSAEYFQNRGGGTNDGFLTALFQDALGRPIEAGARASFDQQLANGTTRSQVAATIFASTEYRQDLVGGYYLRFLHRPADSGGLANFVAALGNGARDEDVIAALVGSGEYLARL